MTTNEWDAKMQELKDILAERLMYNDSWEQVQIKVKKTFLELKWFNAKQDDLYDPEGKVVFKTIRIAPLNKKNLWDEVEKQQKKLAVDKKHAEGKAEGNVQMEDVG